MNQSEKKHLKALQTVNKGVMEWVVCGWAATGTPQADDLGHPTVHVRVGLKVP
jgi:hypothetical protein